MGIREEVVSSAESLASKIDAGTMIIISPYAQEIKRQIKIGIPILIASVIGGRSKEEDVYIDLYSKMPKKISKESLFLKVSRIELMSEAVEVAYIKGLIKDKIVIGIVIVGDINSIVVINITDIPLIKKLSEIASAVDYNVIKAALNLALEIGREGRERKRVGTAFIIGDIENVMERSRQLILNPFEGHKKKDRDITDENTWETIKEFAQLDGMFLVDDDGYIVSAGRYLDVSAKNIKLTPGLGGRHLAAASITQSTKAIAITISESTRIVTVYKNGVEMFHIDTRVSII
jgi:DNA integrity scanning protein DisA with diadenylate cyclase activity